MKTVNSEWLQGYVRWVELARTLVMQVSDDIWAETWMLRRRPVATLRSLERTFQAEGSVWYTASKDGFCQFLRFLYGHATPTIQRESFFLSLADAETCLFQAYLLSLVASAFPLWSQLPFKKFNCSETAMLSRSRSYKERLHQAPSGWRLHQLSSPTQLNATKWVNTNDTEEKNHPAEASQPTEL